MNLRRVVNHLALTHWQVNRAFPPATLGAIETAIKESEGTHVGEIRFVVEGALDSASLLRGQSTQERALDVFSQLRLWDTEHNNGVLIYVLLADRAVEIVADRGIHAKLGTKVWETICRSMEDAFRRSDYAQGAVTGIQAVTSNLVTHFPAHWHSLNELPDEPILL
ncbi:MAG: TPM domain-containing protein [Betaproteobacteria bacterium]